MGVCHVVFAWGSIAGGKRISSTSAQPENIFLENEHMFMLCSFSENVSLAVR